MKLVVAIMMMAAFALVIPVHSAWAESPVPPDESRSYKITAAGASFPFPLIDRWRVEINNLYPDFNLNYQSIGSGGGVKGHIEGTISFAGTDAPLTASEQNAVQPTLHIPEAIGAVNVVYTLPEVPDSGLNLTGQAVADIFEGRITKWNDPVIADANPNITLPDRPIVAVHRSDGSGTTKVFTQWLSSVSESWDTNVGTGKSVGWPIGIGAPGNEGVAAGMADAYTIGYVSIAYALTNDMSSAAIENGDGTAFVIPSLETTASAAGNLAQQSLPPSHGDWKDVHLLNAPGVDSYPIATFTYLLVYEDIAPVVDSLSEAQGLVWAIHWMITDGQEYASELGFVPLPEEVVELGNEGLSRVTYQGQTVYGSGSMDDRDDEGTAEAPQAPSDESGGCLIATAAYGSELAPQVQMLREIRDGTVMGTASGKAFMTGFNQIYYSFSPAVADLERENPILRDAVRLFITPMLSTLSIMSLAEDGSEAEILGLGLSVMVLNIGMYVVAPAVFCLQVRKRMRVKYTRAQQIPAGS